MEDIETLIQDSKDAQRYEELTRQIKSAEEHVGGNLVAMVTGGAITGLFGGVGASVDDFVIAKVFCYAATAVFGAFTLLGARNTSHYAIESSRLSDEKKALEAKYSSLEKKVVVKQ